MHSGVRFGVLVRVLSLVVVVDVLVDVERLVDVEVEGREVSRGGGVRVAESEVRVLDRVDGGGGSGVRSAVVDERVVLDGDDDVGVVFVGRAFVVRAELAAVFTAVGDTRVVFGAVVRIALVDGAVRATLVRRVVAGAVDVSVVVVVVETAVVSVPIVPLVPNTKMVEPADVAVGPRRSELPAVHDDNGDGELDVPSGLPNPGVTSPDCCTTANSGACATAGGPADTVAGGEAPAMAATTPAVEATSANVLTSTRTNGAFTSPP